MKIQSLSFLPAILAFFSHGRDFRSPSHTNTCWGAADSLANPDVAGSGATIYNVSQTTAHEIGHVIVGAGHPDENDGAAPLPGTTHSERLMANRFALPTIMFHGSMTREYRKHRLVKGEWDKAEGWLSNRPNGDQ